MVRLYLASLRCRSNYTLQQTYRHMLLQQEEALSLVCPLSPSAAYQTPSPCCFETWYNHCHQEIPGLDYGYQTGLMASNQWDLCYGSRMSLLLVGIETVKKKKKKIQSWAWHPYNYSIYMWCYLNLKVLLVHL